MTQRSSTDKASLVAEYENTCAEVVQEFVVEILSGRNKRKAITVALVCQFDDGTHHSIMAGSLNRVAMGGILQDLILEMFYKCKENEVAAQIQDSVEKITLATAPLDTVKKPN